MADAPATRDHPAGPPADRPPGRVRELGHIVLYVADLERSLAFYRDLLGWPVAFAPEGVPAVGFSAGATHHDLLPGVDWSDPSAFATARPLAL